LRRDGRCELDASRVRTGLESDFADHEPSRVEVELCLDEARDAVRDRNDDVASELDERVAHVVEDDGRPLAAVDDAADAERQHGAPEHPHVLREHVVGVEPDGGEVARALELEEDLDVVGGGAAPRRRRRLLRAVVPPSDPLVALVSPAVRVQPEVVVALDAVGQLAESSAEVVVGDATVVREVVQVDVAASSLALRHVVRQHPVYAIRKKFSHTFSHTRYTERWVGS